MTRVISKNKRLEVWEKYDRHCCYCGVALKYKDLQVDHIFPKSSMKGRTKNKPLNVNHISNLMPSCRSCNLFKSNNSLESFRKSIENQINILRRDRPTFRLAERYGLIQCNPKRVKFFYEDIDKRNTMLTKEISVAIVTNEVGTEDIIGIHRPTLKGYKLQDYLPIPVIPLEIVQYKDIKQWLM